MLSLYLGGQSNKDSKEQVIIEPEGEEVLREARGIDKDTGLILKWTFSLA
jgi:hypothetical protein